MRRTHSNAARLALWLVEPADAHAHPILADDAFLLKFDGQPGRAGLGLHVDDDGLGLSINLLLSDPADFKGGGTFFEDGKTVIVEQGEMVSHHGGLRHSSVPTVGGQRYILVAFLRSPALISAPPEYVNVASVCQATMGEAIRMRERRE